MNTNGFVLTYRSVPAGIKHTCMVKCLDDAIDILIMTGAVCISVEEA